MSCPLCHENISSPLGCKNNFKLVTCQACGFIHVDPMPTTTQLEELYQDYRQTKNYLKKLKKKVLTSRFKLKRLKKHQSLLGQKFLDVGCSVGATVEAARRLGYQSMGIDLDEPVVKQAQEIFSQCEFKAASTGELIAMKRRFDLIYCAEVIEHVPEPHQFVQSLADLLNNKGLLFLTTPDAGHRKVPKDFVSWNRVTPPEHIGYFNRKTMQGILQEHGFKIIKFYWSHRANLRVLCQKNHS